MQELAKQEKKIRLCQSKIGELVFNLYMDQQVHDDNLKMQIKTIIDEVEAEDVQINIHDLIRVRK